MKHSPLLNPATQSETGPNPVVEVVPGTFKIIRMVARINNNTTLSWTTVIYQLFLVSTTGYQSPIILPKQCGDHCGKISFLPKPNQDNGQQTTSLPFSYSSYKHCLSGYQDI